MVKLAGILQQHIANIAAEREKTVAAVPGRLRYRSILLLITGLIMVLVIIAAGLFVLYRNQEQSGFRAVQRELDTIAGLRADQISDWRSEKLMLASAIMERPLFVREVSEFLESGGDAGIQKSLRAELSAMLYSAECSRIALVDGSGGTITAIGNGTALSAGSILTVQEAVSSHQPALGDVYLDQNNETRMDAVAPLFLDNQNLGAVVLSIDPRQYLFPMISSWPTASNSAEMFLIEQSGDHVLVLNELRQKDDTALVMSIPLSRENDPAVLALKGFEQAYKAVDYRGIEVMADSKKIPGSDWHIVAAMDTSEIYSMWNLRLNPAIWFVSGILVFLVVLAGFLWQRRQQLLYLELSKENTRRKAILDPFDFLVKYSNDIVLICDNQNKVLRANERALASYGYTREEMAGVGMASLIAPAELNTFQGEWNKIAQKGMITAESIHKKKDNSTFPVEIVVHLIKIEEKNFLQVVVRDISERKVKEADFKKLNSSLEERVKERTDQLETANKELEAFAYSVSHDLRAPLRGIDGWSQALAEDYKDSLGEKGMQILNRIRSETVRMGQLIDDLLKFSRETRSDIKWQEVDMTAIAQTIADRLQQANATRQIKFVVQPGIKAVGDPRLLEIALTNLLDNAVKYTLESPHAQILFGEVYQQGKKVFLVRDNGIGFDMAYAHKLFKVFQRLHKSSLYPGTGIGLATVHRIITRHGGRIWAEAQANQGASFYFTLKDSVREQNEPRTNSVQLNKDGSSNED